MGAFIARRLVKMLVHADIPVRGARVGILGLTFKEDVNDIRNSRVPDILAELREFGIQALLHDPHANAAEVKHEYGLTLTSLDEFQGLDAVVLAVSHAPYLAMGEEAIAQRLRQGGAILDVKSMLHPDKVPAHVHYWSL
jgi:UDP-N-acetyl-D-galactosamine dehydrogenase